MISLGGFIERVKKRFGENLTPPQGSAYEFYGITAAIYDEIAQIPKPVRLVVVLCLLVQTALRKGFAPPERDVQLRNASWELWLQDVLAAVIESYIIRHDGWIEWESDRRLQEYDQAQAG